MYKRKLVLLGLIIAIYCLVSFWVPYSKYWFMKDIMQTQARMYFAMQSAKDCRDLLIRKAEALDVPVADDQVTVQTINGEIIYLEIDLNVPYSLFSFESTLHFDPKIFGLIRSFEVGGKYIEELDDKYQAMAALSDSTQKFLRNKTLRNYFDEFFAY
ncbi:MAG TPA: hypothetical protein VJ417_08910 [Candidatus Glassbacteria bacterium]|nr:hypothetical protein [Candidatus Glassbacteria bacterium]